MSGGGRRVGRSRSRSRRRNHEPTEPLPPWGVWGGPGCFGQTPCKGYGPMGSKDMWCGDPASFGMWGCGDFRKDRKDKEKRRKDRKKRSRSSSSSSSSSSSDDDEGAASEWQKKLWAQAQQAQGWQNPGCWGMPQAPMWQGWGPQPQSMGTQSAPGWPTPVPMSQQSDDYLDSRAASSTWGPSEDRPDEPVPIFLEPAVEELVPVPKALLGKVIGKQAQTIIEIREKSGAFKVDARDQSSDPCQVKVAGTAEAVAKARELILELVESAKDRHVGSTYVEIPRSKIGMVIGLKGAQVNEIQMHTGTKIDVDFTMDPCRCYVKGPDDNVERAKQVLLTIAMQIEDDQSEYLDLPKSASGALIGVQGSRVREFQEQSGARIDVDKTGPRCRVRLSGGREQVANAKQLIMAEVENSLMGNRSVPALNMTQFSPQESMVVPAHQPAGFPATLSESIARAKAAAMAVKSGLITSCPPAPSMPVTDVWRSL